VLNVPSTMQSRLARNMLDTTRAVPCQDGQPGTCLPIERAPRFGHDFLFSPAPGKPPSPELERFKAEGHGAWRRLRTPKPSPSARLPRGCVSHSARSFPASNDPGAPPQGKRTLARHRRCLLRQGTARRTLSEECPTRPAGYRPRRARRPRAVG